MLDSRYFEDKINDLELGLKRRNLDPKLFQQLSELSRQRRELIQKVEALKAQRNATSQEIAQLKAKAKSSPEAAAEADTKVAAMREVGDQIKALDGKLGEVQGELNDYAMQLPNIPHSSVPSGRDSSENKEVRR